MRLIVVELQYEMFWIILLSPSLQNFLVTNVFSLTAFPLFHPIRIRPFLFYHEGTLKKPIHQFT